MASSKTAAIQKQLGSHRQKVDVDSYDITVRELVRMCGEGELRIAPPYQRKFRWTVEDESRLIESLLLGLPVPSLYVATNEDGSWEIVDGLQRLSTILHFLADPLKVLALVHKSDPLVLTGLEKLTECNGLTFAELPPPLQISFPRRSLRVTALSDKSDFEVRFELFERLNRGGIALSAQEVRACIYRGDFEEWLDKQAQNPDFRSLLKLKESEENDGTPEELVLKYLAYLRNRSRFDGRVTEFLNNFMEGAGKGKLDLDRERALFDKACTTLHNLLQGPILRSGYHMTPLNQAEAILVAAAELISHKLPEFKPSADWLNDAELIRYSTKGTNTRAMLKGRIRRAVELLSGKPAAETGIPALE